ncbi:MAG: pyruvate dehydrogenase complex E1 component subunit beta [Bacteroidota bacterium]|nr:pyruvate dehydrogenase complex E1 component subunit beta [Rhodothermia bacterium]MCS7155167.1 pyruvate dehydrogenase complex E1 component subunit beta [Bacteroidota bacterium]MDW8138333.1 pyruvate dehydrogenase complex E1 component subunit beta [Bacteroidota bacterium]MDW8286018.1 pyruvate dehydrogenase complex E1 component subunit beta [Bacteroidota bacterium]
MAIMEFREAIRLAMIEEMERDERVFLMGEEVGLYDGAYKVSKGMLERFGPMRVVDTPISEAGFAGIGIGAAMVGLRPIIEFMTWNFSLVAMDQLVNHAASILYMSGGQFPIPIVFRGPNGAAGQLGATHSRSLEATYAHWPGLKVVTPSTPADAKGLLKSAIRDDNPVLVLESELMYSMKGEVPEDPDFLIPLGVGEIKRPGRDVTVVAHSKSYHLARMAAQELEKDGIDVEIIDPRTIRPLDIDLIVSSVKKTNRLVIIDECAPFGGVASEIAYQVQLRAFDYLDAPIVRITTKDTPAPYAKNLYEYWMPRLDEAIEAIKKVLYR